MTALLREVIGDVLRRARTEQGRTLREVSDTARVSLGYLSEVERGRKEASSELLSAICGALDVPLSRVLSDAGEELAREELAALARASAANIDVDHQGRHPAGRLDGGGLSSLRPAHSENTRTGCGDLRGTDKLAVEHTQRHEGGSEPMANPFVKAWKYLMALFSSKVDEYADPKVQIQQAIEEAQRQHQALTQQAAQVIGNQRQLEMRLNRQLADIEKLQVNVRQALTLADQATAAGDAAKATEYNNAAEAFAAQLVTAEQSVEDLKGAARPGAAGRRAGQEGRRAERDDAAAEDRRAHQAAQPARAGQDAGAGQRLAAVDERARRAGQHPEPRRGARQDRTPLRQRHGLGRARAELGAGPDDGGAAGQRADGRAFPAGADPRLHAR